MKIRAEVVAVETMGDKLAVTMQGKTTRESARWGRYGKHRIEVQASKRNGQTYYVGRVLNLEMRV